MKAKHKQKLTSISSTLQENKRNLLWFYGETNLWEIYFNFSNGNRKIQFKRLIDFGINLNFIRHTFMGMVGGLNADLGSDSFQKYSQIVSIPIENNRQDFC